MVTLDDALRDAAGRLAAAGIPEPRREAERIWAGLTGRELGAAFLARHDLFEPSEAIVFTEAVSRRSAGEPLAYVTGRCGFRYLDLRIDRRALIPRPETEGLVTLLLERVTTGMVADIGTGSGCVALSLLTEGRFRAVTAVDRSAAALSLARENAARVGAAPRFVLGDLTAALATGSCDALVSNPPYLTDAEHAALDGSVRCWEPAEALVSGADGLAATRALLSDGHRVVRPGGWIALELDANRAAASAAIAGSQGWIDVTLARDLFGRERYLLARRSES